MSSTGLTRRKLVVPLALMAIAGAAAAPAACGKAAGRATAEVVAHRSQLIGGPDALGDLGDLKISNGKVRFIVQGLAEKCPPAPPCAAEPCAPTSCAPSPFSRGWGVYTGSVVDADLARPASSDGAPNGNDRFGELFPALFLEAIEPSAVEIGNDGTNGEPATIVVSGRGAPFLTLARSLLDLALKPDELELRTTYSLGANDQFLTVRTEVTNATDKDKKIPADGFRGLGIDLAIPFGHVLLFGARNDVFVPGVGFNLRYGLEASYAQPPRLPALNGLVTDLIATRADGVSYGFVAKAPEDPDHNYVWKNREVLGPEAAPNKMLVPFFASSFTGVFSAQAPPKLGPGETWTYTNYFLVGTGDVGSLRDVQFDLERQQTGRFSALVREAQTGRVVPEASLIVLDSQGRTFSQYTPDPEGRVTGRLPKGDYQAVVVCDHRQRGAPIPFEVRDDFTTEIVPEGSTSRTLEVPQSAQIIVRVTEAAKAGSPGDGRPMPAKVTILAETPWNEANAGKPPRDYLYNLGYGERMLPTDGLPDTAEAATRRYVERVVLAGADGLATGDVRPGVYSVRVSRGPEYDAVIVAANVEFKGGQVQRFDVALPRVVDTTGYISADFHVHTSNSIDGHIDLDQRVLSYAAEGVEFVASTDHNVITDLRPNAAKLNLLDFLTTTVGVEMTTLEMGHFNAFPLRFDPGPTTHGAFDWVDLPPRELFQSLRWLASTPPDTVVQVNHPRDSILGYYAEFEVNPETGRPRNGSPISSPSGPAFGPDKFSWNFDAMEVFNGKRAELLRTYRMPETPVPEPKPSVPIGPGEIVRLPCPIEEPPKPCDYSKQEVAFPGSIDDWFVLLNQGGTVVSDEETIRPVTATGNSDSHGLYFEEAGTPRNWVRVGKDDPRLVTDREVARAVRRHALVFSNGPFIDLLADGGGSRTSPVGGLLAPISDSVKLTIKVSAAPWVDVNRVLVYVNGVEKRRIPVNTERTRALRYNETIEIATPKDAWIVVAAEGDESLFPEVTPLEDPPLSVSDAVGAIAGPLGLAGADMGNLHPAQTGPARPFAMTNPIWIDRENKENGPFGRDRDAVVVEDGESPLVMPGVRLEYKKAPPLPVVAKEVRQPRTSDLGRLFRSWGHGHSH